MVLLVLGGDEKKSGRVGERKREKQGENRKGGVRAGGRVRENGREGKRKKRERERE